MKKLDLKKVGMASVLTALNTFAINVMVKAGEADFLKPESSSDATLFKDLNTNIQNLGASAYSTLRIVAIIFGCIGLLGAAFMMASGSATKLDAAKSRILWTFIAIILAFSAVSLIAIAIGVGSSIN